MYVCTFVFHFDLELFVENGDNSWSSIQRGRNRHYQRKTVSSQLKDRIAKYHRGCVSFTHVY